MEIRQKIALAAFLSVTLSLVYLSSEKQPFLKAPLPLPALSHSPSNEEDVQSALSHSPSSEEDVQSALSHSPSNEEDVQSALSHSLSSEEDVQPPALSHSPSSEEDVQPPALSHSPSSEEDVQRSSSTRGTLSKECFRYHNVTADNVCCPMLRYAGADILRCVSNALLVGRSLKGKRKLKVETRVSWLFLGDSHTRYIFCALFSKLSGSAFEYRLKGFEGEWRRLSLLQKDLPSCGYKGGNIEIRHTTLPFDVTFHRDVFLTELQELKRAWEAKERPWPTLIVINNGMHWMRKLNPVYLESGLEAAGIKYEEHLRTVAPVLHSIAQATTVVFKMQDDLQTVHNATSMVAAFSAANLAFYNAVFRRVLGDTDVLLWDSTLPLSLEYNLECIRNPRTTKRDLWWMCEDRTHVGYVLIHQYADMLLNLACNKYMGRRDVCYGDQKW